MKRSPAQVATIGDVAKLANVSIATVSRVVNASTPVIPETAERVHEAIRALNYVPKAAARVLASRKTHTLGLLLPEISGDFFPPLLRGIETAATEAGFALLIQTTSGTLGSPRVPRLGEHNTDGLLIFSRGLPPKELERLHRIGMPVVLLHQSAPDGVGIPTVTVENKNGALLAVEHLIQKHGRKRIAFLRGPEGSEDSSWRERGYLLAHEQAGLTVDPALMTRGGFSRDGACEAVRALIRDGICFDAIFSGDDDSATGALTALRETGLRVPVDVSLIGFDDVPFSTHLSPPLTTVRAPTEQVGREAVRQLLAVIRGEIIEPLVTLLPTQLITRASCGCKAETHISTTKFRQAPATQGRNLLQLVTRAPRRR
jgi:DNA-binding LacI/PurR family transcriptional regulator